MIGEGIARQTLVVLALNWPYYGRSVDRLWTDGGTKIGFRWCHAYGWAEYVSRDGRIVYCAGEALVRPTDKGLEYLKRAENV